MRSTSTFTACFVVVTQLVDAYNEASLEVRRDAIALLKIATNPESRMVEKRMAISTLCERLGLHSDSEPNSEEVEAKLNKESELFAKNLEAHMTRLNMSQDELARIIGISQPAIANLLNRRRRPQRRTIKRIAEALKMKEIDLLI